jgi:hypothetical protein
MRATRFEIVIAGLIAAVWIWAVIYVLVLDEIRGPLNPAYQSEMGEFFNRYDAMHAAEDARAAAAAEAEVAAEAGDAHESAEASDETSPETSATEGSP